MVPLLRRLGEIARYRLKRFAGTRPMLYFPLQCRFGSNAHLLVTQASDACIEGYPRSANSFAVSAFQSAQPREVTIAHHTHVAANLLRACELGVPAVLLVRSPRDAVVSRQALKLEARGPERPPPPISLRDHLQSWVSFYRATRPYVDRCVIALFPQVIDDFGVVIQQVNEQFGKDFGLFEHSAENVERIRAGKGYHALPSERRDAIKARVRRNFEQMLEDDPAAGRLLADAEALYGWYERRAS